MNKFEEWKGIMETRVKAIASSGIPEKYRDILVDRAVEPYGLWVARETGNKEQPPGNHQTGGVPATDKQKATIRKHMEGKAGEGISSYMNSMGRTLDNITKAEASTLIDRIFRGDFRGDA